VAGANCSQLFPPPRSKLEAALFAWRPWGSLVGGCEWQLALDILIRRRGCRADGKQRNGTAPKCHVWVGQQEYQGNFWTLELIQGSERNRHQHPSLRRSLPSVLASTARWERV